MYNGNNVSIMFVNFIFAYILSSNPNVIPILEKNLQEIDSAMNQLNETWSKISTELYQQTQSQDPTSSDNTGEGGVEDVQFEEVK